MTDPKVDRAIALLEGELNRVRTHVRQLETALSHLRGREWSASPSEPHAVKSRPSAVCPRCGRTVALRHRGKSATSYDHNGGSTVSHRFNADTGEVHDTYDAATGRLLDTRRG